MQSFLFRDRRFILTLFIFNAVVRIPKATILSTKSCFLSHDITSAPYGHTARLALALALYGEMYVFSYAIIVFNFWLTRVFCSVAPVPTLFSLRSYHNFTFNPDSMNRPGFTPHDNFASYLDLPIPVTLGTGSLLFGYTHCVTRSWDPCVLNPLVSCVILRVCSLRGRDSRWFGYLQSLPRETVDLSIFWGVEDVIDFSSSVCSSRGRTTPSQSAVGYVGPSRSPMELPGHTPSLQLLDGKQARTWLSCIEVEKELDSLMVSFSSYCIYF